MTTEKFLRWQLGQARITRILDLEASGLAFLLPEAVPEKLGAIDWLSPFLVANGEAVAAIQSFVIESGSRRILVDSGAGERARSAIPATIERAEPYLEELVAAGFAPDTIDTVIHTHLHFDHVGWNMRPVGGKWAPTFPNARHLVVAREWAFWSGSRGDDERAPVAASIRPLMAEGRVELVEAGQEIAPGVRLEATSGHTPGHVSVRIRSDEKQAVISGDVMHHPVQLAMPDWTCTWDSDPAEARLTRQRFLDACADSRVLVIGTHFARLPAGFIIRAGSAFRFEPCPPNA